ncbi:hypothetical protein PM082_023067 [Marasmius tenuissimus]|nr:hypothetical protein PM082_023067 [Marasmius tenuissimus]
MSDDNLFSAPRSPVDGCPPSSEHLQVAAPAQRQQPAIASGHHSQYPPLASRLIQESQDSTIQSDFSPAAFDGAAITGTDASIDQVVDGLDDALMDHTSWGLPESTNKQQLQFAPNDGRVEMPIVPEASTSSVLTPSAGKKAVATFDPTPYRKALGRDYSRATIFEKASIMHIYGGLGVLTLMGGVLHMCHVLPVAIKDGLLMASDEKSSTSVPRSTSGFVSVFVLQQQAVPFLISRRSVTPTFHYAIDTGLIKFLPTADLMDAMEHYPENLHDLMNKRKKKQISWEMYNEILNGDLSRRKLFTPANYPFALVAVLCHSGFLIPRHNVDDDDQEYEMPVEEVHNEGTEYEVSIKRFPIPLCRITQPDQADDSLDPRAQTHHQKTARVLPSFRALNPTKYDENEVFWLWSDPFFVLMNAGEFVSTLRNRWESKHPHTKFVLASWIETDQHAELLQRALDLYEAILGAPSPEELADDAQGESPSRPTRTATRSRTASSRAVDNSRASMKTRTKNPQASGSQRVAGTKRDASAMDENDSRTQGTRRSRRLKLEEPEPDMNGRTQL